MSWQGACIDSKQIPVLVEVVVQTQLQDWRLLSEAASREQDPERLIQLVEELNRLLLRRELQMKRHAAN
jgi:hypothetical protein